jgi:hypothetical protein
MNTDNQDSKYLSASICVYLRIKPLLSALRVSVVNNF